MLLPSLLALSLLGGSSAEAGQAPRSPHTLQSTWVPRSDPAQHWAFEPEPGAERRFEVALRAVDENGAAVPGARLWMEVAGAWTPVAHLDPNGAFAGELTARLPASLTGRGPERCSTVRIPLAVEAPGFAAHRFETLDARVPEHDLGTAQLVAGGSLHGRVVDAQGVPVVDARVHVGDPAKTPATAAELGARLSRLWQGETQGLAQPTDAEGRFQIHGLRTGRVRLVAHLPESDQALAVGAVVDVGTSEPQALTAEVALDDVTVTGKVVDPEGAPVADTWVRLTPARLLEGSARAKGDEALVRTDAAGRFRAHVLAPYDVLEVVALGGPGLLSATEYAAGRATPLAPSALFELPGDAPRELETPLRLRETQGVPLEVLDDEGELVAGAWAWVRLGGRGWVPGPLTAVTDDRGRAYLHVPPTAFSVEVRRDPEGRRQLERFEPYLSPGRGEVLKVRLEAQRE